jgi:CO dehydrogenase maturation factor
LLDEGTSLVLDMEAGVEHLGRGTVQAVDCVLVVVEPGRRSVETAMRIKDMASDLGLQQVCAVGNKIRSPEDEALLKKNLGGMPLIGLVPYDEKLRDAEINGRPAMEASRVAVNAVEQLLRTLERDMNRGPKGAAQDRENRA